MIIQKDGKTLDVTEKAYRVIFQDLGYKEDNNGETRQRNQEGHETQAEQEGKGSQTEEQSEKQTEEMTVPELKERAKNLGIEGYSTMKKNELIEAIEG